MILPIIHKLFFTWTGWPADGSPLPPDPGHTFFSRLADFWETDGIRFLSNTWRPDHIQVACEVQPAITPVFFTARIKGRLQHALRQAASPADFSRKIGMRAIGENVTDVVESYLREQLQHAGLADPRYRERLAAAAVEDPAVDLTQPTETSSGRYWYNLHLVLVAHGRYRIGNEDSLPRIRPAAQEWATAAGTPLKSLAVMPDHVHAAVRGDIAQSPADIVEGFRSALNRAAGCILYSDRMYVGTFSEYSLRALR